jgi:Spy/CpxP family protein refolding chaperone
MKNLTMLTLAIAALFALAPAASAQKEGDQRHLRAATSTPYMGEEARQIKALSAQDVEGYLAGRGMGMARAAELNHYPGPMHVLELADSLGLSAAQRTRAQELYDEVKARAVPLGAELVEAERRLDALFASAAATTGEVDRQTAEIGRIHAAIRAVHLNAHISMREALTPEQIGAYDRLRGYGARQSHGHH